MYLRTVCLDLQTARKQTAMKHIIVHCADTPNGVHYTARDIDQWHAEKVTKGVLSRRHARHLGYNPSFPYIAYHAVGVLNGSVQSGRAFAEIGSHCHGYNQYSLGYCLIGRDKYTWAQWIALAKWVKRQQVKYPEVKVIGHNEVNSRKSCPGFDVQAWLANGMIPLDSQLQGAPV